MSDAKTRLLEAEHVLHRLEMRLEQYRFHLEGLSAHPHEAQKARADLDKMISQLGSQRRYCDLLRNAVQGEALDGSSPRRARG
jgi:hypothetical protein